VPGAMLRMLRDRAVVDRRTDMKPQNILWLHKRHPNLEFTQGDVRDADRLWH